ncbi:MAG: hypothetical protein A3E01_15465 [Gammaproteobacteria bacterium RIFCSPHIGHO2_12_FULL_63_22]|nr:MAG: hypothetical protein A3E01_15465 [Gammaproteobacteria bacterium RIFCSPHIGHO2_12_FULL_63_22]
MEALKIIVALAVLAVACKFAWLQHNVLLSTYAGRRIQLHALERCYRLITGDESLKVKRYAAFLAHVTVNGRLLEYLAQHHNSIDHPLAADKEGLNAHERAMTKPATMCTAMAAMMYDKKSGPILRRLLRDRTFDVETIVGNDPSAPCAPPKVLKEQVRAEAIEVSHFIQHKLQAA